MAPLGIIAGLGELPVQVADAAIERGQGVYVLRLKGFEEPALATYPGEVAGIAEIGKAFKAFRQAGCEQICFAGIVKRPDFQALKPDLKGISLLPKAVAAARQGDDALLSFLIKVFEDEGFEVIGADQAAQSLTIGAGSLAGAAPTGTMLDDLKKAAEIATVMGRHDIGQGAIVANGLVLCVEAQEGTDEMLRRCADLPSQLRGSPTDRAGVLVKRPKPDQERRIDLPTIGLATVELAAEAGLAGIGFEADGALILNHDAVKARAEALGLFLYGFPEDWP
ncbi:MAG: UDP-2,3-diacylglucosamine diphosphatase LpxI [Hyphomonadaceae bacterium]|nr:UDP-2,3-diacylglucosamine diphosphatase LpxI [Hyphomonadaceae bacterium]